MISVILVQVRGKVSLKQIFYLTIWKMSKKIIAFLIALVVVIFPFRRAFLSDEEPGIMMMISFVLTLIGIGIFYYLTMQPSKDH